MIMLHETGVITPMVSSLCGSDTSGAAGRAEGEGTVLCCEGSEEGCRPHG